MKAAENGDPRAMHASARILYNGEVMPQDIEMAHLLATFAKMSGYKEADELINSIEQDVTPEQANDLKENTRKTIKESLKEAEELINQKQSKGSDSIEN